ncbi:MAG: hypothetical protein AAGM67_00815, partial [Bacteroidota bacterium]
DLMSHQVNPTPARNAMALDQEMRLNRRVSWDKLCCQASLEADKKEVNVGFMQGISLFQAGR